MRRNAIRRKISGGQHPPLWHAYTRRMGTWLFRIKGRRWGSVCSAISRSHTDIKKEDIDNEITIYSSDSNAKWLHFEIIKTSDGFKPKFEINDNKVVFEKTLLKQNDYFSFSGLLDSNNSNLNIGHRIFNVPALSIKLKERDLLTYKRWIQYSPITFLLAALLFSTISPNKINTRDSKRARSNYTKEDSIRSKSIEFDKFFYLNNKLLDIDSVESVEIQKQIQMMKENVDSNSRVVDSLAIMLEKSPSDTNKIELLRSTIDLLSIDLDPLNNEYTKLRVESNDTLFALLKHFKLDTTRRYHLNDSVTVKFSPNILFNSFERPETGIGYYIAICSQILMSVMICLMLLLTVIFGYKYYILRKLMKTYDNQPRA